MNWRIVLIGGVVAAIVCAMVGLVIDRSEVGVAEPKGVYYVHQWPSPFEREVYLGDDHNALLSEGDAELWYFASGAILALTLASLPLLVERELRRDRPRAEESPPVPRES
jgi:hypothetical protein